MRPLWLCPEAWQYQCGPSVRAVQLQGSAAIGPCPGLLPLPALAPSNSSWPPAMTLCRDQSLPSMAAKQETEGFPALGAGTWSLGICQAPLEKLCYLGSGSIHHQKV